jgi:hypothetical protein
MASHIAAVEVCAARARLSARSTSSRASNASNALCVSRSSRRNAAIDEPVVVFVAIVVDVVVVTLRRVDE